MSELLLNNENIENKEDMENTENVEIIESWDKMNLNVDLLRGIYAYGFEVPSEIQKKGILPIINGKDIIAQAQSGSGKTGCFSVGTLQSIDTSQNTIQAIIIKMELNLKY